MINKNLSVIIPMFNGERVILRAIESVLNQTINIDEIIVVNDGSTDNSVGIVQRYIEEKSLSNVKIFNKENGGVSSARNTGILNARNEYISFLDCDDEWLPNKIELQLEYITQENVALVGGNHFRKNLKRIGLKKALNKNVITLTDLLFKNYFQPSTVITKKSLALKCGCFNEKQCYAEEGLFFYKMSCFGELIHLNKQLVIYDGGDKKGFGHSGLSGNIKEMQKGELSNLKYAHDSLHVGFSLYVLSFLFSNLKFIRRLILSKLSCIFNRG